MTEQNQPQAEPKQQPQPTKPKPENLTQIIAKKSAEAVAQGIPPAPVIVPAPVAAPQLGVQYQAPVDVATYTTEDQVDVAIKQFMANVSADWKGHPYSNKSNPLHKIYVNHFAALHAHHAKLKAESGEPTPLEVAVQKRVEKESKAQAIRVRAAEIEMEKLGKLGFDTAEIPADISEIQYQLLKAESLYAKEKFLEGDEIAMDVAREMKISSSTLQSYFNLRNTSESADAKKVVANQITFFLNDEHKKQRERLKALKAEVKNKVENPTERPRYPKG